MCSRFFLKYILAILLVHLLLPEVFGHVITCKNYDCQQTANSILRSMKTGINPCDDFYEYACGNFKNWHPNIPENQPRYGFSQFAVQRTFTHLRQLLEEPARKSDAQIVAKTKQLYRTCMDVASINRHGVTALLEIVDSFGGWPIIMQAAVYNRNPIAWDVVHFKYARMTGAPSLFAINVEEDPIDNGIYRISVNQPHTMTELFQMIDNPISSGHYKAFLKDITNVMTRAKGTNIHENIIEKDINDVIQFRKQMKAIMINGPDVRDERRTHNLRTIRELQHWNNEIARIEGAARVQWLQYLQETFKYTKGINLKDSMTIILKVPQYLKALLVLIGHTSARIVVNHIHLYFVEKHAKYAGAPMQPALAELIRKISNRQLPRISWKTCVLENQMRHVLSKMYVQKYFPDSSKVAVTNLVMDIKNTFKTQIQRSPWMDKSTKEQAVRKLDNMKIMVGYEDWVTNGPKLSAYYRNLEVGNNFLKNILSSKQMEYAKDLEMLRNPRTIESKTQYAFDVNAYYVDEYNSMDIQAALLQWPYYTPRLPDVVIYAVTASIISHEMAHAFDSGGRLHDYQGRRVNWWSASSLKEYNNRAQCIHQQYQTLPVGQLAQLWSNADRTRREDFADVLAMNVAYDAYHKKAERVSEITKLPGLEKASDNQLFFLAYANKFCEYINPKYMKIVVESDQHNLPRLRVNGPLINLPEFSAAFNCSVGSYMNRTPKCTIWK